MHTPHKMKLHLFDLLMTVNLFIKIVFLYLVKFHSNLLMIAFAMLHPFLVFLIFLSVGVLGFFSVGHI